MEPSEIFEAASGLVSPCGSQTGHDRGIAEMVLATGVLQSLVNGEDNELLVRLIRGYALVEEEIRFNDYQARQDKGGY